MVGSGTLETSTVPGGSCSVDITAACGGVPLPPHCGPTRLPAATTVTPNRSPPFPLPEPPPRTGPTAQSVSNAKSASSPCRIAAFFATESQLPANHRFVPPCPPGQVAQRIRQLPGLQLGPLRDVTVNWRHGGFLRLDPHVDPAVRVHRTHVAIFGSMQRYL